MTVIYLSLLGAALGASLALPLASVYNAFPEAWLQDYDYNPKAKNFRPASRMMFLPHTVTIMIAMAFLFFAAFYLNGSYVLQGSVFHILLMLVPLLSFSLIVVSDKLNRIIPDQLVVSVAVCSIFGFLADKMEGSFWISPLAPWYMHPLNRILGAVIGAGLLWGIGTIGSWFSGQESMGFGDIKLIFACGLLSGGYGLIFVFFIAFILGGVFALPLFVAKRRRIRKENLEIRLSEEPEKKRREIEKKKNDIHFSQDPDYIAFGPFLALGTALFLIFETPIYAFFTTYILQGSGIIF